MANSKKTPDYTLFWLFWMMMIVMSILLSCRTSSRTEDRMQTSRLTDAHDARVSQHVIDSLLRNMNFTFTGLELWMSPAPAPLPQGTPADTARQTPQLHLRADKATASLSEMNVTDVVTDACISDSATHEVQEERHAETAPHKDKGGRFVLILALLLAIFLAYKLPND